MLYSKDIIPMCAYCIHASQGPLSDYICRFKGVVLYNFSCRRYKYDPIARIPAPRPSPVFLPGGTVETDLNGI